MTASGVDPVRSGRSIILAPMPCKQTLAGYRMAFYRRTPSVADRGFPPDGFCLR